MHLFKWLAPKKKAAEGLVMRISTPELGLELTNVARVSQQVARDILIRFSKEHTVILDDYWKQEKVR